MNRILGGLHYLVAAVVALFFVIGPFWDWGESAWEVFNYFMALAVLLSLYYAYTWKKGLGDDADTKSYVHHKTLLLGAVVLALWFFYTWFTDMQGGDVAENLWLFSHPLFVLVTACVGDKLWNQG